MNVVDPMIQEIFARQAFEQAIYKHALAVQVEWKMPRLDHDGFRVTVLVRADLEVNVAYETQMSLENCDPVAFERVADSMAAEINLGRLARTRDAALASRAWSQDADRRRLARFGE